MAGEGCYGNEKTVVHIKEKLTLEDPRYAVNRWLWGSFVYIKLSGRIPLNQPDRHRCIIDQFSVCILDCLDQGVVQDCSDAVAGLNDHRFTYTLTQTYT